MDKELRFRTQFFAYLLMWFVWIAAIGWTFKKDAEHSRKELIFAYPLAILLLLLVLFPIVLTGTGILSIRRSRRWSHLEFWERICFLGFVGLTPIAFAVFLFGIYLASDLLGLRPF